MYKIDQRSASIKSYSVLVKLQCGHGLAAENSAVQALTTVPL
jgi:hypothetical protein